MLNAKSLKPILASMLWIGASEFLRNQIIFSSYWTDHYASKGFVFPSSTVNGAIWGVWSLLFATVVYVLNMKFSRKETMLLAWVIGFVMMWLVIGNLGVLPYKLLWFAVPLSILETCGAVIISSSVTKRK